MREPELGERRPLHMDDADRVERDVDTARLCRHGIGVPVDRLFVERVNFRDFGFAPDGGNTPGYFLKLGKRAPGQEHLRALARESARDRAADRATAAVDHRRLVLEQHFDLL